LVSGKKIALEVSAEKIKCLCSMWIDKRKVS
jgi:hypothetical protein